jgi:hypothetical protein
MSQHADREQYLNTLQNMDMKWPSYLPSVRFSFLPFGAYRLVNFGCLHKSRNLGRKFYSLSIPKYCLHGLHYMKLIYVHWAWKLTENIHYLCIKLIHNRCYSFFTGITNDPSTKSTKSIKKLKIIKGTTALTWRTEWAMNQSSANPSYRSCNSYRRGNYFIQQRALSHSDMNHI